MAKVYDTATDLITFARLQAQNTTSGSSYLGSDGLLKFAAEDEPRIEYGSDGSLKGLLIEEQRSNLVTHSEDFSQSVFIKDADVQIGTTNNDDPAGGNAATQINVSGSGRIYSNVTSGNYFTSVYIKPGTFSNFRLAGFLIDLGVTPPTNSSPDGSIDVLPNNWFRVTVGYVGNRPFQIQAYPDATYAVHTQSGDYQIWGAQVEQGSFPTSYIPTSGGQSTRSPDIASIPVSAFGYNQEAGTVVVEASYNGFSPDGPTGYQRVWHLDQASGKYLALFSDDAKSVNYRDDEGNVSVTALTATEGVAFRAAAAFSDGDAAVSGNGGVASTASPVSTLDMPSDLSLGSIAGLRSLNGHIKSLSYFPRRLTDAQLQELTA